MKFYDLSLPLSAKTAAWPGQAPFSREETKTSAIVSRLELSSHFGTHVDAPKHFLFNRAPVDKIPLEKLVGRFRVVRVASRPTITGDDVKKMKPKKGERILFRTKNSDGIVRQSRFTPNYVSLSPEGAHLLAKAGVWLVGIDYFGIEAKGSPGHPVHTALLKKHIVVVEGLNMAGVAPGGYDGAVLPLKVSGGDGSPARAVLWK